MKELELLARRLDMTVLDVVAAIQQAKTTKLINIYDKDIELAVNSFNWEADQSLWKWVTSSEALTVIWDKTPNHTNVTAFSLAVINTKGVQRRRSNGRNLLLLPPIIGNRD